MTVCTFFFFWEGIIPSSFISLCLEEILNLKSLAVFHRLLVDNKSASFGKLGNV